MVAFLIKLLLSYLLGSVNGSLVLGQVRRVDIREAGSGNAGGTNALRTQGRLFALGVILIDVGKSVLATTWVAQATIFGAAVGGPSPLWVALACGGAAVIGHCYPLFYGFRGGKGMATLLGVYAVVAPGVLLWVMAAWFATMAVSGYVGRAPIVGAAIAPVAILVSSGTAVPPLLWFGVAMAGLIIFTHRDNIVRMRRGEETRFSMSWLARR